jgi:DNA transposition AAA+ family ATPase
MDKQLQRKTAGKFADGLRALKERDGLTLRQLGAGLGYSEAMVSRYLGGTFEGDIAAFDAAAADMLEADGRKRTWEDVYFETAAVETCFTVFDIIREASDIGLVHGPAGIGKSTACARYAAWNPTVIALTCTEGRGHRRAVLGAILDRLDTRKLRSGQHREDWLRDRLSGSGRLIIIDNAQRVTPSGLRWLFDFQEWTRVSVALVGNPEVLDRLAGNDQMTSRIGFRRNVGDMIANSRWLNDAADAMVRAMWPEAAAEIAQLARESVRLPGLLRRLNKQLRLAMRLCESDLYRGQHARAFVEARHLVCDDDGV